MGKTFLDKPLDIFGVCVSNRGESIAIIRFWPISTKPLDTPPPPLEPLDTSVFLVIN